MNKLAHRCAAATLLALAHRAWALIYLPENTLESLLLRSDAVIIGTVSEVSETDNRGRLTVEEALKGEAKGELAISGVMLRVKTDIRKPRFAAGDRVLLFCSAANESGRPILHSQTLASAAEVRTMKGCIAEIQPVAQLLTDLADPKKPLKNEELKAALKSLVTSPNAYTQILVGRLMATRLTQYVKPEGWEEVLTPALASQRKELVKGALTWAEKFEKLPDSLRAPLGKLAANPKEEELQTRARALLK